MKNNSGAMIMQIDLKKRKLQQQILQLQRQLHKKQKKTQKEELSNRKQKIKMSVSPRQEKNASKLSFKDTKQVKPAISDNWKQLFKLQPQLYQAQSIKYFDKQDYRVQAKYEGPSNQIQQYLRSKLQQQWENCI